MAYYEIPRITCDACGAEKKEVNHWWLLFTEYVDADPDNDLKKVTIEEWSMLRAEDADAHACGESCAHTLMSRWFANRTFDAPAVRSEPGTNGEQH